MDTFALAHYVREVSRQAAFAAYAMRSLNDTLTGEIRPGQSLVAFANAQAILTAGAQVSRLFWADTSTGWSDERRQFAVDRAATLRRLLRPDQLLAERRVRNSVEHFDERLDNVVCDGSRNIVDANITPRMGIYIENSVWLRNLEPDTYVYSALEHETDLRALDHAIQEVGSRADVWIDEQRV